MYNIKLYVLIWDENYIGIENPPQFQCFSEDLVYCTGVNSGLFFTALAIISIHYDNIVLSKVIVEISKCGCSTNNRSDGASSTSGQRVVQVVDKPPGLSNLFGRENKG